MLCESKILPPSGVLVGSESPCAEYFVVLCPQVICQNFSQCGARRFANTGDNRDRTVRLHGGTSGLVRSARPKLAGGPQYLRSAADHASQVGPLIETHGWMF